MLHNGLLCLHLGDALRKLSILSLKAHELSLHNDPAALQLPAILRLGSNLPLVVVDCSLQGPCIRATTFSASQTTINQSLYIIILLGKLVPCMPAICMHTGILGKCLGSRR